MIKNAIIIALFLFIVWTINTVPHTWYNPTMYVGDYRSLYTCMQVNFNLEHVSPLDQIVCWPRYETKN